MKIHDTVEKINIDKLYPYHNNPKEHPPDQIDNIASSIKNYGFTVPIIIDGENEIISGHGRYKAAKKLGMKELPAIKRKDLTEEQIKAFRIADNKVAESEWDMEQLMVEMEAIEGKFTGFDDEEFNEVVENATEEPITDELEKEKTEGPAIMQVKFEKPDDFKKMEDDLRKFIEKKYPDVNVFIKSGELSGDV